MAERQQHPERVIVSEHLLTVGGLLLGLLLSAFMQQALGPVQHTATQFALGIAFTLIGGWVGWLLERSLDRPQR